LLLALLVTVVARADSSEQGALTGTFRFPGGKLPEKFELCARAVASGLRYCTAEIAHSATGEDRYTLSVPAGRYFVFAGARTAGERLGAYASKNGRLIAATVFRGQTLVSINPTEWRWRYGLQLPDEESYQILTQFRYQDYFFRSLFDRSSFQGSFDLM